MTPEETAARMAAQLEKTARKAAECTVESTIGEAVLRLFAAAPSITLDELIASFEETLAGKPSPLRRGSKLEAETAISALLALRKGL